MSLIVIKGLIFSFIFALIDKADFKNRGFYVVTFLLWLGTAPLTFAALTVDTCSSLREDFGEVLIPAWATSCHLKEALDSSKKYEELLDELNNGESQIFDNLHLPQLIKVENNIRSTTGLGLDTVLISKEDEFNDINNSALHYLLNTLIDDFLKLNFLLENKVFLWKVKEEVKPLLTLNNRQIREIKISLQENKSLLSYLQGKYPQSFYCTLRTIPLFDEYSYDGSTEQYPKLRGREIINLTTNPGLDSSFYLEAYNKDELAADDFPLHSVLNMLVKHGFISEINNPFCGDEEDVVESSELMQEQKACYQRAITEVVALDPDPLEPVLHIDGSGTTECHFIKAHWQPVDGQIPLLAGEFIAKNGTKSKLECRNIKVIEVENSAPQIYFNPLNCRETPTN